MMSWLASPLAVQGAFNNIYINCISLKSWHDDTDDVMSADVCVAVCSMKQQHNQKYIDSIL